MISPENLIGARVIIKSLTHQNDWGWKGEGTEGTIEDIGLKVSLDGKCFAVVTLKEYPDKRFTLGDLKVIKLPRYEK